MPDRNQPISTGVTELDQRLGGLFIGDNVIWYDEAGSLATPFTLSFIRASRDQERSLIYVSFDRSPKTVVEELGPLAESQYLIILDCFTYGKGDGSQIFSKFYEKDGAQWPYQVVKITEPHKPEMVMEAVYRVHQGLKQDVRLVFESLTGMQDLWGGEEQILKFYSRSCPRLYELETIAYWLIERGAHSTRLKAHINQIAQVVVDLTLKRGKATLTINKAQRRQPDSINQPTVFWSDGAKVHIETDPSTIGKLNIGLRLKALRTQKGISQKQLAQQVGVTPSTISQIEGNLIYPSLPALVKLAQTLAVDVSSFFHETAKQVKPSVFGADDRSTVFFDLPKGSLSSRRLLPLDFDGQAEPYLIEIPPQKKISGHFFSHKGEEMGYLICGSLKVVINNTLHTLNSGDVVYLTAEFPSQWKNIGDAPAQLLWLKLKP
jgi:transcriptional regulator with XRE-family HTH domain/KaiC/GvpD/RAD55 family RecA-like ATPase